MRKDRIDYWKNIGYIQDNMTVDEKINLSKNLDLGKSILSAKAFLSKENYSEYMNNMISLYPVIVFYGKGYDWIGKLINDFINFFQENFKIKYEDDYLLCIDFIKLNS